MQNIQFVYESDSESEGLLFLSESTGNECKIFYFSETEKVMLARLGLHLIGDFSRGSVASVKTGFPNTSTCLETPISELVLNLKRLIN